LRLRALRTMKTPGSHIIKEGKQPEGTSDRGTNIFAYRIVPYPYTPKPNPVK